MERLARIVCASLLALATSAAAVASSAPTLAADGFGRPRRLDVLPAGTNVRVAIAGSAAGPLVVWEDAEGLSYRAPGADEAERLVHSPGIRGLAAGAAGGDPVVAWSERDLATGLTRFSWRWREETRHVFETRQAPRIRLVAGGDAPQLLVATPGREGWRLALYGWEGGVREAEPRSLTVAGLDAVRQGDAVIVAWLEGSDEVTLGSVERDWTAYLARWPDGRGAPEAERALGDALRVGADDAVRLGTVDGSVYAMWPGPDGRLRTNGPDAGGRVLGAGTPLGLTGGAWTWSHGDELRRAPAGDGEARSVLRLPSAPERIAVGQHGGVTGVAWSSGRYLGGIEVWGASDRTAYQADAIERIAFAMGWDPWRPWSAAGGHLLLALLAAVLAGSVLTPAWWLGATLLARRHAVGSGVAALEGSAVAVLTVLAVAGFAASRATLDAATVAALLGWPGWILAASTLGIGLAWLTGRARDAEPAFARLVAAWVGGGTMLFVLAFGTIQAWQTAFGAVA